MHLHEAAAMLGAVISIKNCALEIVIGGRRTLGIKLLWWLRIFLQFSEHCVIKFMSSQAMDVCPQWPGNKFHSQLNRIKSRAFVSREAISSQYICGKAITDPWQLATASDLRRVQRKLYWLNSPEQRNYFACWLNLMKTRTLDKVFIE